MKIQFDIEILEDDLNQLIEDFSSVEYITASGNYENNKDNEYLEVTVDSKDLNTEEFDNWIKNYLDMGYSLEWDGNKGFYMITED